MPPTVPGDTVDLTATNGGAMDSTGHDETPEVTPPHRRSARNPGARAVVVVLAVVAVVAGAWWVLDAVL